MDALAAGLLQRRPRVQHKGKQVVLVVCPCQSFFYNPKQIHPHIQDSCCALWSKLCIGQMCSLACFPFMWQVRSDGQVQRHIIDVRRGGLQRQGRQA